VKPQQGRQGDSSAYHNARHHAPNLQQ
jgi:hypothetical protein